MWRLPLTSHAGVAWFLKQPALFGGGQDGVIRNVFHRKTKGDIQIKGPLLYHYFEVKAICPSPRTFEDLLFPVHLRVTCLTYPLHSAVLLVSGSVRVFCALWRGLNSGVVAYACQRCSHHVLSPSCSCPPSAPKAFSLNLCMMLHHWIR